MKKLFLFFSIMLSILFVKAQQIKFISPVVYNDDPYTTITAQGENNNLIVDMDILPEQSGIPAISSPANGNYQGFISLSNINLVSHYNGATGTKSAFTAKLTNTSSTPITATYTFNCTFLNLTTLTISNGTVNYTVTINPGSAPPSGGDGTTPPTTTYWNTELSSQFPRSNCTPGYIGSMVTYTVPAHTYSSSSQENADLQAEQDILNNRQNYANTYGTCTVNNNVYARLVAQPDANTAYVDVYVEFYYSLQLDPRDVSNLTLSLAQGVNQRGGPQERDYTQVVSGSRVMLGTAPRQTITAYWPDGTLIDNSTYLNSNYFRLLPSASYIIISPDLHN
jgi:hypothetical protein